MEVEAISSGQPFSCLGGDGYSSVKTPGTSLISQQLWLWHYPLGGQIWKDLTRLQVPAFSKSAAAAQRDRRDTKIKRSLLLSFFPITLKNERPTEKYLKYFTAAHNNKASECQDTLKRSPSKTVSLTPEHLPRRVSVDMQQW